MGEQADRAMILQVFFIALFMEQNGPRFLPTARDGLVSQVAADSSVEIDLGASEVSSISLRYLCQHANVSDIKRLNGLMCDQDLYALQVLKIPVSRYSIVEGKSLNECVDELSNSDFGDSHISDICRGVRSGHGLRVKQEDRSESVAGLFSDVDRNLEKVRKAQELRTQNCDSDVVCGGCEVDLVQLANRSFIYRQKWLALNVFHYVMIIVFLFVIIVLPLTWLLYKLVIE
ncbi:unnamed protein product [Soboliphyme baturini]|uniref:LysM domain-containing protein n=1 Tax=Soboliphyme baturini TaxID=241478 RepID=A0A183ILY1_9BILA|nr:unnamed protein product [Soboliphyme baturini]